VKSKILRIDKKNLLKSEGKTIINELLKLGKIHLKEIYFELNLKNQFNDVISNKITQKIPKK
jgi:tRNA G18 (ribose-2'-O)-methylase SpoU